MSLWDAARYGFSPVYWLQIAGVPVVFGERATGLSLPAGWTAEDGSLSIDDSAEIGIEQIDRETGTAVSLSLSFKLLDTATVRSWLRTWSKSMTLTADVSATATAWAVDDTTGWSNGDVFHAGMERCTIGTVASGTSITGVTRATVGTLAYAHATGTSAQIITDLPRYWRGRDVTLWASPCDASGFCTGSALLDDARMVWRGRLEEGPTREVNGFRFTASSLDRVMARSLAAAVTGSVVDTDARAVVSQTYSTALALRAHDNAGASVWAYNLVLSPFTADTDGDLLTFGQVRDRWVTAWATAVTDAGAGADLGGLVWAKQGDLYLSQVTIVADATITGFSVDSWAGNIAQPYLPIPWTWTAGGTMTLWECLGNPLAPDSVSTQCLVVKIDNGDPAAIPAPGVLRVNDELAAFVTVTDAEDRAYFTGLSGLPSVASGDAVEVLYGDNGTLPDMMLRCLMSSGTTERSATYDTLPRGQGYGIDDSLIDADSFTDASAPIGSLQGEVATGGQSFADLFGGSLGMFRKAVVCRPDVDAAYSALKLTMVDTAPYGAGYADTIGDLDLLSDEGDPVLSVKRAESPNVLRVVRPLGGASDAVDAWTFTDAPGVDAAGADSAEYRIPATDRAALWLAAGPAAAGHLTADQTTQAIELRVAPWVTAEVGDTVWIDSTHPALWTWSANPATVGYTGAARVVGRRMELRTQAVVLTVLADAGVRVTALSPSAVVVGFDVAAAPSYIDVPLGPGNGYLQHFTNALADAGANVWVQHYTQGGVETTTQRHEISAAASVGGNCRLTVATTAGGHSLSIAAATPSHLTLPTLDGGDVTTWQATFAHNADGTSWG